MSQSCIIIIFSNRSLVILGLLSFLPLNELVPALLAASEFPYMDYLVPVSHFFITKTTDWYVMEEINSSLEDQTLMSLSKVTAAAINKTRLLSSITIWIVVLIL